MSMTLYEILGVNNAATQKELKLAYNKLAKENHTDKGGDNDKMIEINKAYGVLSIPAKRVRYDETGLIDEMSMDVKFRAYVGDIFVKIILKSDVVHNDLIFSFIRETTALVEHNTKNKKSGLDQISKLQTASDRLNESSSAIKDVLLGTIVDLQRQIAQIDEMLEFLAYSLEILNSCEYTFEDSEPEMTTKLFTWNI